MTVNELKEYLEKLTAAMPALGEFDVIIDRNLLKEPGPGRLKVHGLEPMPTDSDLQSANRSFRVIGKW